MKRLLLALMASLFCIAPAIAWDEPDAFRGVKWGTSRDEASRVLAEQAKKEGKGSPQCSTKGCLAYLTIGPVHARGVLSFHEDKFAGVTISFEAADYPVLRPIFIERYGEPTARATEEFKTKGGLSTSNEVLRWDGQNVFISLRAYAGNIKDGAATIILREELDRRMAEQRKQIKKGKGDL